MLADDLLHPDHVVPASELVAALVEVPDLLETEVGMESLAVVREVFVLRDGAGYTGVKVKNASVVSLLSSSS